MKIIMGTPPEAGAYHGCPYRHMPENQLVSLLGSLSIGGKDLQDIVGKVKGGHFQVACQYHFDITHPEHQKMQLPGGDTVANHPNAWIQASVSYHKAKNGTKEIGIVDGAKGEDASQSMEIVATAPQISTSVSSFDAGSK